MKEGGLGAAWLAEPNDHGHLLEFRHRLMVFGGPVQAICGAEGSM